MKRVLIALALVAIAYLGAATMLVTRAEAMTAHDAAELIVGNYPNFDAADDDFTKELYHYKRLGWNIVTADFGSYTPLAGHQVDLWAYYQAANGKKLWTKFRVRDPSLTADGWWHDYVQARE